MSPQWPVTLLSQLPFPSPVEEVDSSGPLRFRGSRTPIRPSTVGVRAGCTDPTRERCLGLWLSGCAALLMPRLLFFLCSILSFLHSLFPSAIFTLIIKPSRTLVGLEGFGFCSPCGYWWILSAIRPKNFSAVRATLILTSHNVCAAKVALLCFVLAHLASSAWPFFGVTIWPAP